MAAKFVDETECILCFSDLPTVSQKMLRPIQGYENMPLVTLEKAVEPLTPLVPDVAHMVSTVKQYQLDGEHSLTDDESASILLYTMACEPRDKSFYAILNDTLQAANQNLLRPWLLYLRLIMTALAKLPSDAHHITVHRGVKLDLSAQYSKGTIITWWGFSSCTTSLEVLNDERFLGRTGTRTLFNIECQSVKSIKLFSLYPEEEEALIPPGCQFQVTGCLDLGNDLHIIQMKEIQPKFLPINPVPQPSTIPLKTKPEPPRIPSETKPQPPRIPSETKPEPPRIPSETKPQPPRIPSETKSQPPPIPSETKLEPPPILSETKSEPSTILSETKSEPPTIPSETKLQPSAIPSEIKLEPPTILSETKSEPPTILSETKPEPPTIPSETKPQPSTIPSETKPKPPPIPPKPKLQPLQIPPSSSPKSLTISSETKPKPPTVPCETKPEPPMIPSEIKSQSSAIPFETKPQPLVIPSETKSQPPRIPSEIKSQPSAIPSETKPQPPTIPSETKPQPIQPSPVEQSIKALMPSNCGNPELEKHIDALYSNSVIISFYVFIALGQGC
jgi:hypothetical protein